MLSFKNIEALIIIKISNLDKYYFKSSIFKEYVNGLNIQICYSLYLNRPYLN